MKIRYIVLALCLLICFSSIAVIIFLGKPQDIVSLDVVTEVAERVIHHVDKTGKIVTSITDEEEMRIGDELHETLVRQGAPFVPEDDQLHIYVNQVGKRVAMNVKRQNIKYKFHVIRSPYPDAFSAPGGHVYITTGFLETLKSEAEMAAVLGHEITHIDAKHAIGRVQYKIASEKILGKNNDVLVDIAYQTLLVPGYSETEEFEADKGGVYFSRMAMYHPMAMVSIFEEKLKSEKQINSSITPVGETLVAFGGVVGRYFNTHPPTRERMWSVLRYIEEKKLTSGNTKFYIGKKNLEEKKSFYSNPYQGEISETYKIENKNK